MVSDAPTGRLRRAVIRSVAVLAIGAAILVPILYYASTVDVRPPQVDGFDVTQHPPGDGGVALTTSSLEIVFSEPVEHASAQAAFRITPSITGAFSWNGTSMIFTPTSRLPLEAHFSVSFAPGVRDLAGNAMGAAGPFTFATVGKPSVVATQPAQAAIAVPRDAVLTVTFSTLMDTASVASALEIVPTTPVDLRWAGVRLTIVPRQLLDSDQRYTVRIGATASDLAGTPLESPLNLSFTTELAGLHPLVVMPADGSQGIAVTTPIALVMDRALDPGSVSSALMTIQPGVAGTLAVSAPSGAAGLTDDAPRILRFTPSGPLPPNTTFTVTVAAGLRARDGTRLAAPLTWSFTTGSPSASLSNQVVFLSDRSGVTNLWAMNPDGTNQHELSAELSPVTSYAVAPDGRTFVVGDGARLIEEGADGQGRRILTDAGLLEFDPSYSPDGSTIVFGRADATTGAGLGLWQRPTLGGAAQQIRIPANPAVGSSSPSPLAAGSSSATAAGPSRLLRAPRYSPDGKRLAFVDMSGWVGILDIGKGTFTAAPFHAVSPPSWLPDSMGVVLSGLYTARDQASWSSSRLAPLAAVPSLDPAALLLGSDDLTLLTMVELGVGSPLANATFLPVGAARPSVGPDGRIAYVALGPDNAAAGLLRLALPGGIASRALGGELVTSVSFAPEAGTLVVALTDASPPPGTPSAPATTPTPVATPGAMPSTSSGPSPTPAAGASPTPAAGASPTPAAAGSTQPATTRRHGAGGIWLVDAVTGAGRQLSTDGWLPRWIP